MISNLEHSIVVLNGFASMSNSLKLFVALLTDLRCGRNLLGV